jgi:hypothetical protein
MNSRFIYGWLVGLCLLLGACKHEKERTIRAGDYEQTCSKDSDCKTVLVGDPCKCSCEGASINGADLKDYSRDIGDVKAECPNEIKSCAKCPELKASVCTAGKCQIAQTPTK